MSCFKRIRPFFLFALATALLSSCAGLKTEGSPVVSFESAFSEHCIARESRKSVNPDIDRQRFEKPCRCIAKRINGQLSKREKAKFVDEHKISHSLTMAVDKAAYFCLQTATQPKPRISYQRKSRY